MLEIMIYRLLNQLTIELENFRELFGVIIEFGISQFHNSINDMTFKYDDFL